MESKGVDMCLCNQGHQPASSPGGNPSCSCPRLPGCNCRSLRKAAFFVCPWPIVSHLISLPAVISVPISVASLRMARQLLWQKLGLSLPHQIYKEPLPAKVLVFTLLEYFAPIPVARGKLQAMPWVSQTATTAPQPGQFLSSGNLWVTVLGTRKFRVKVQKHSVSSEG